MILKLYFYILPNYHGYIFENEDINT